MSVPVLRPSRSTEFAYGIGQAGGGFSLRRIETRSYLDGANVRVDVTFTYGLDTYDNAITGNVCTYDVQGLLKHVTVPRCYAKLVDYK
jgi:hypothetical protein